MPRYKQAGLLAMLLFLGVVLRVVAKDFWEAKSFTEWNEPEAMKMLSESPWSRTLLVLGGTLAPAQAANRVSDLPSLSTTGAGRGTGVGQAGSGYGPFGPGQRWKPSNTVLSHIIGNWQVNGIVLLHSGVPFNLSVPGDRANTANNGYLRPDYVGGDVTLSNPTPAKWFNTGAFALPAAFKFGTAGRHILRRDGMENLDFSIFRQFPIMESRRLEFRAEMFNALNNPVFGTPNGNITSADFGKVFGVAKQPRQIQLALKFIF